MKGEGRGKGVMLPMHVVSSLSSHSVLAVCVRGDEMFVADGGEKGSISVFSLKDWVLCTRTGPQEGSIVALCLAHQVCC